jgi:hypothetical protein
MWSVPLSGGGPLIEGTGVILVGRQAFDAKTGKPRSEKPDGFPIAVVGDTLYQSVYRRLDQPQALRAVDVHTGAVTWSRDTA